MNKELSDIRTNDNKVEHFKDQVSRNLMLTQSIADKIGI